MRQSVRLSTLLFAVVLAPGMLQTSSLTCEKTGDTTLSALALDVDGENQIAFHTNQRAYDVPLFTSSRAATLRVTSTDPNAQLNYNLSNGGFIEGGFLGIGSGEVTLDLPAGETTLAVHVKAPGGATDSYTLNVDRRYVSSYPCTEQGILDAVLAGGAALIDCQAPTTVTTTAEIVIDKDLLLSGNGNLTVDGAGTHRAFYIPLPRDVTVDLRDMTISGGGGATFGGAILNEATLTLTNVRLTGNAGGSGSAVYNYGTLSVFESSIVNNASAGSGGGIFNDDSADAVLVVADSTISNNTAATGGGAIMNEGDATVTNSTLSGNTLSVQGGKGGGIENRGQLVVDGSTISDNAATFGGGIYSILATSSVSVDSSVLSGNAAEGHGGGIYQLSGTLTVTSTTVSGNTAKYGGGINVDDGTATLTNSTLSDNTITEFGTGGGLNNGNADVTLIHSTVAGNHSVSDYSSAIYTHDAPVVLTNTLIEGDCGHTIALPVSNGYNVESPGDTCNLTDPTDQPAVTTAELKLGALGDHGGATPTMVPIAGSVAVDRIPAVACLPTDQRGIERPQGSDCDVGAVEISEADNAFPCTEQGIRDAIAAGDGPFTFDCVVPTTITTAAEIVIDEDVILDGGGILTLDGNDDHRVFSMIADVTVEIRGMTITRGNASTGGCLYVGSGDALTLVDSMVTDCVASSTGGGIQNSGQLTLDSTVITRCSTSFGNGGGILNSGSATLIDAAVLHNTSEAAGGGIQSGGSLTATNSRFTDNVADDLGGGIHASGATSLTGCEVSRNTAPVGAGMEMFGDGFTVTDTVFSENVASVRGGGIAIYSGAVASLTGVSIDTNEADFGAGIYVFDATLTLDASTQVSDNIASGNGGGLYVESGSVTLTGYSEVFQNTTFGNGGGLYISSSGTVAADSFLLHANVAGADGGGAYNEGVFAPSTTQVGGNSAVGFGGGIFNAGSVLAQSTGVQGNDAAFGGGVENTGALDISDNSTVNGNTAQQGGGIRNSGTLTSVDSSVSGNSATNSYGGGIVNEFQATATLTNTTVSTNDTMGDGGGIFNAGDLTLDGSTVSQNTALDGGGGVHVFAAAGPGTATATLVGTEVSDNDAQWGGGIQSSIDTTLIVTDGTVSGNSATIGGGGIHSLGSTTTVSDSTLSGNDAADGGGFYGSSATTDLANVTISGNQASAAGGGLYVTTSGPVTRISHVTVMNNDAPSGAAIQSSGQAGSVRLNGTVLQGPGTVPTCVGSGRASYGYNVEGPSSTCLLTDPTDLTYVAESELKLGALVDNGGPTQTHAPLVGSVVIDVVPELDCVDGGGAPLTRDQRGQPRPLGTGCDVGAVEHGGIMLGIDLSTTTLEIEGPQVPYTATVNNGEATLTSVGIQAYIEQGAASRSAAGTFVRCDGVPDGELPPGTCVFDYVVTVTNGGQGTGTLVAGPATARFELRVPDGGGGYIILDEVQVPVTLTEPVQCPCFSPEEIEYNRATFSHPDAYCSNATNGWRLFGKEGPVGGPHTLTTEIAAYHRHNPALVQDDVYCYKQLCGLDGHCVYTLSGWGTPPGAGQVQVTAEEWAVCRDLVSAEIATAGLTCN